MPCSASSVNPFPGRPVVRMLSFSTSCSFSQWMVVSPYSHTSRRLRIPPSQFPNHLLWQWNVESLQDAAGEALTRTSAWSSITYLKIYYFKDPMIRAVQPHAAQLLPYYGGTDELTSRVASSACASYPFYRLAISWSYVHRIHPFHVWRHDKERGRNRQWSHVSRQRAAVGRLRSGPGATRRSGGAPDPSNTGP
jgi:hypothetical protein